MFDSSGWRAFIALSVLTLAACGGGAMTPSAQRLPVNSPQAQTQAFPGSQALSTSVDWPTWGFNAQRTGFNPNETVLTTATVPNLVEKWSFPLATKTTNTQPIVASRVTLPGGSLGQIVYVADEGGHLYAVRSQNGKQLWSVKLGTTTACGGSSTGITSAPVIDRTTNRLYVIDGQGMLWGFDLASGKQAVGFAPLQAFTQPAINHTWSGLLLSKDGSTLYYPTSSHCDTGTYYGTINAVNTTTQTVTTFNLVTDPSTYYGDGVWSWGGEAVDPSTGNLYAGVGNSFGALGENEPNSDSVIELTSSLGFVADEQPEPITVNKDWDIGTTPIVYDDWGKCIAFGRKDGNFFTAVRTAIANGVYATKISLGGQLGTAAYSPLTHALYVDVPNGLTKLHVGPNCTVTQSWQTPIGGTGYSTPVVAGGVVYAAGKSVLYAIDANTGAILWNSGTTIGGAIAASPTVVNGQVYAASWDGHLYAFGL